MASKAYFLFKLVFELIRYLLAFIPLTKPSSHNPKKALFGHPFSREDFVLYTFFIAFFYPIIGSLPDFTTLIATKPYLL
jgi:hypothetical protein